MYTRETIMDGENAVTLTGIQTVVRRRRAYLQSSGDGITLTRIAKQIGIKAPEFINLVEKGKRSFELNKIPLVADAFRVDRRELCKIALYEEAPRLYKVLLGNEPVVGPNDLQGEVPAESEDEMLLNKIKNLSPARKGLLLGFIEELEPTQMVR
jgi:hypothetical protein